MQSLKQILIDSAIRQHTDVSNLLQQIIDDCCKQVDLREIEELITDQKIWNKKLVRKLEEYIKTIKVNQRHTNESN